MLTLPLCAGKKTSATLVHAGPVPTHNYIKPQVPSVT